MNSTRDLAYYKIKTSDFNKILDNIESIKSVMVDDSNLVMRKYDYYMVIKISYYNRKDIYIASNYHDWTSRYVPASIDGLYSKTVHINLDFRDLNILFQSIDKNMVIFLFNLMNKDILDKWEENKDE